eukprot:8451354-Pyramimonas_sp.AAC.1
MASTAAPWKVPRRGAGSADCGSSRGRSTSMSRAAMEIPGFWASTAEKTSCLVAAAVMTSAFTVMAR